MESNFHGSGRLYSSASASVRVIVLKKFSHFQFSRFRVTANYSYTAEISGITLYSITTIDAITTRYDSMLRETTVMYLISYLPSERHLSADCMSHSKWGNKLFVDHTSCSFCNYDIVATSQFTVLFDFGALHIDACM